MKRAAKGAGGGKPVSILLFSRKTRTDPNILRVAARSIGPTETGLEQLCDASLPVLEQRLGVRHPVFASIDAESGEDLLGFFGLARIIGTFLVRLDKPCRLTRRASVRLNAS